MNLQVLPGTFKPADGIGFDLRGFPDTVANLTHTVWRNPHPDRLVTSFDFISAGAQGAPFLVAATVEP
jgi:hypothetical protein